MGLFWSSVAKYRLKFSTKIAKWRENISIKRLTGGLRLELKKNGKFLYHPSAGRGGRGEK